MIDLEKIKARRARARCGIADGVVRASLADIDILIEEMEKLQREYQIAVLEIQTRDEQTIISRRLEEEP